VDVAEGAELGFGFGVDCSALGVVSWRLDSGFRAARAEHQSKHRSRIAHRNRAVTRHIARPSRANQRGSKWFEMFVDSRLRRN